MMRSHSSPHHVSFESAAACLSARRAFVVEEWERRVRAGLPASHGKRHASLIDSLPDFLAVMIDALVSERMPDQESLNVSQRHADQRAHLRDYDLGQVLSEYRILRQVLFEELEARVTLFPRERDLIFDMIQLGQSIAANRYSAFASRQEREATSALREVEERLNLALAAAHVGIWDLDLRSGKVAWSREEALIFGFSPDEPAPCLDEIRARTHPDDLGRIDEAVEMAVSSGREFRCDFRIRLTDGTLRWVFGLGRIIKDAAGAPARLIGANIDITAPKVVEETVMSQQKWLMQVLDDIPVPLVLMRSSDGTLEFANSAAKKQALDIPQTISPDMESDYFALDCEGRRIPHQDLPRHRLSRGEEIFGEEILWHSPEGEVPLLIHGRHLKAQFGHEAMNVISILDISERKRSERVLKETIETLEREKQSREQFVNLLTHDLRNPLGAAKMGAQLAMNFAKGNDRAVESSARAFRAISRADVMLQDLLDVSRISAGAGLYIDVRECDLSQILSEVRDELAVAQGARYELDAPPRLVGLFSCKDVRRAIENMASNAAKYGDTSRPIRLSLHQRRGEVEIAVHNWGKPIPQSELPNLFDAYLRLSTADNRPKGWGLGLTLVKGVAEAHGGTVLAHSSEMDGTEFIMRLPLRSAA